MPVTTPAGFVVADDQGVRLEFVRLIDFPVERVWAALTDSALLGRWFGTWTGDPADGTVLLRLNEAPEDAYPDSVAVLECEPPTRLSVVAPGPDGPWPLVVELQPRAGGATFLLFTHRLAEPYDATDIGPGWHYYLDRMTAVASDEPVPDDWESYYPALSGAYALPDAHDRPERSADPGANGASTDLLRPPS